MTKKLKSTYRVYASGYAKNLHVLWDPFKPLGKVIDKFIVANGGRLDYAGRKRPCERFYVMKSNASARKCARIMTGIVETL